MVPRANGLRGLYGQLYAIRIRAAASHQATGHIAMVLARMVSQSFAVSRL